MTITELQDKLMALYEKHGDMNVMIDCYEIRLVEHVHAIDGEHGQFVDLVSEQ